MSQDRQAPAWLKPATEYGPLLVFVAVYATRGLLPATAALLAATAVGLLLSWLFMRRLPLLPLVTALLVGVFGGLTLWLQDDTFIKMKPTIVNALFGVALLGGLAFGRSLLGYVFNAAFQLDAEGWRKLTIRWGIFFLFLAVLNEVVWRNFSDGTWVAFKVWGTMPITIIFTLAQMPLVLKHSLNPETDGEK